jgi:hypothetical protein
MRKSCAQFVYSAVATCGRTHDLYACPATTRGVGGGFWAVIPHLLRTNRGLFYTALGTLFSSVNSLLFPTIHMTNNNYNFLYIPI